MSEPGALRRGPALSVSAWRLALSVSELGARRRPRCSLCTGPALPLCRSPALLLCPALFASEPGALCRGKAFSVPGPGALCQGPALSMSGRRGPALCVGARRFLCQGPALGALCVGPRRFLCHCRGAVLSPSPVGTRRSLCRGTVCVGPRRSACRAPAPFKSGSGAASSSAYIRAQHSDMFHSDYIFGWRTLD